MSAETHDFEYQESFFDAQVVACCSCGWQARLESDDIYDARDEWDNHCEQVFIQATERPS